MQTIRYSMTADIRVGHHRGRSDIPGFFTDIRVSSPTSDISHRRNMSFFTDFRMSVKAPKPTAIWVCVSFFGDAPTFKVVL